MKKFLGIFLALAVLFTCVLALAGCSSERYELAVVTDVGQLMDKGFNQGTWEGVKAFGDENGISYKYYQPANGNEATDQDRIDAMELAIANGAQVVVAPGFLQATAMTTVAIAHPTVNFIFIDGWPLTDADGIVLENVVAVAYQEEQSGFFAGYAAVMEGYTKLGYTGGGGGTNPACNRFGYGYVQGAEAAAKVKNVNVEVRYSYQHGETFSASTELQTQISGWYTAGTEVVFACGGSMFSSVVSAAEETANGKVIGVDVDQSAASDRVITSAVKGLSESVQYCLEKIYANKWSSQLSGQALNLGAVDGATGLPKDTWSLENFSVTDYEALFQDVVDGDIEISNTLPETINQAWFDSLGLTKVTVIYE
ncbi:MAG: BMP family ABC transporter substrate-binding protein [Clostridia bacterium]|nr:BMP family ABC transporter substrate-binding protein [Clostridia bacterium]